MKIFLFTVFILFLLWYKLRHTINFTEGLILVFANKGTGKTTLLALLAYYGLKRKKYNAIYSNVPIKGTFKFSVKEDLGKKYIANSLLLIDEGASEFSNLDKLSEEISDYLRQQRHYKDSHRDRNDIIVVSQSHEDMNIRVRRLYDAIYIAQHCLLSSIKFGNKRLGHKTKLIHIQKFIGINEETKKIDDLYDFSPWWHFKTKVFKRKKYYHLFDSLYKYKKLDPMIQILWEGNWPEPRKLFRFKKRIRKEESYLLKKTAESLSAPGGVIDLTGKSQEIQDTWISEYFLPLKEDQI